MAGADLRSIAKEVEWKRSPPPERALVACEAGGAELVCELIQVIRSGSMNGRSWLRPLFLQRPLSNGSPPATDLQRIAAWRL